MFKLSGINGAVMNENKLKPHFPVVGVMGSGTSPHEDRASRLGCWLAKQGVHLLTGGGEGVMASVSKAFYKFPGRTSGYTRPDTCS